MGSPKRSVFCPSVPFTASLSVPLARHVDFPLLVPHATESVGVTGESEHWPSGWPLVWALLKQLSRGSERRTSWCQSRCPWPSPAKPVPRQSATASPPPPTALINLNAVMLRCSALADSKPVKPRSFCFLCQSAFDKGFSSIPPLPFLEVAAGVTYVISERTGFLCVCPSLPLL